MVGTVKPRPARALKKGEQAVLLPGPDEAHPWESWLGSGPRPEKIQVCAAPEKNSGRQFSTLALPVRHVFCLPLWLNETNEKQFPGMIALQLELRGLQGRGKAPLMFDWSVAARENARALVVAGILPEALPDELQVETYRAFDVSARYFPFAPNSLTLWLEQERLAVAVTRGPELVYYQALSDDHLSSRVLQDLICIRGTLEMGDVLSDWRELVLWTPLADAERSSLQTAFNLPLREQERPGPRPPKTSWSLVPSRVSAAKKLKQSRRWQFRLMLTGLAVYMLVVLALAARYLETKSRVNQLLKWQAEHADALNLVHSTQTAWQELRPAWDKKSYPLEQLLHCTEAIPSEDLHLTLFEQGGDKLLLKAEARNAAAAFQFADALKKLPAFADYTWDMSQPHLLPNDLAQSRSKGPEAMRPLTKNEKTLLVVLVLLVLVGGSLTGYRRLQAAQTALDTRYANLRAGQLEAEFDLKKQDLWAARLAWIKKHEPPLGDEGSSKAQVLETVLRGARDNQLEIIEQNLDETQRGAGGARVTVDLKVKGSMEGLCRWLTALQKPESFYAVLDFSLKADQDQKSMVCSVQIARYFQEGP